MFGHQLFTPVTKQTSKTLGMLHHRFLTPVLEQRWRKMMTAYGHCGCCTIIHYIDMRSHMLYVSVTGKWWSNTVLSDTPGVWWCLFFQMAWMIVMFSLKHAWTLGPGIYPGEPKHGASSETRKPCKTGYIRWTSRGPPFCGCKNGSKTTILNKGFNKEQLA